VRTATKAEVDAEARRQQREALERSFGRFAGLARKMCAKKAERKKTTDEPGGNATKTYTDQNELAENIGAACWWAEQQTDLDAKSPAYVETSLRRALEDKRYRLQGDAAPAANDLLEAIGPRDGAAAENTVMIIAQETVIEPWLAVHLDQVAAECFRQVKWRGVPERVVAENLGIGNTTVRRKAAMIEAEIARQFKAHMPPEPMRRMG